MLHPARGLREVLAEVRRRASNALDLVESAGGGVSGDRRFRFGKDPEGYISGRRVPGEVTPFYALDEKTGHWQPKQLVGEGVFGGVQIS